MSTKSFSDRLHGYRQQFASYTLTELGAAPARVILLRKPGWERMEGVDIVFLGASGSGPLADRVLITGDLCPNRNAGCASDPGYDLGWFLGATSHEYLCGKFLRAVWVPEAALEALRDKAEEEREARELGGDPLRAQERGARIQKLTQAIEEIGDDPASCGATVNAEKFCDLWIEVFGDTPEDQGFSYSPRDAALLVAIQETFARLYTEHQKKAAEPRTGDALTGPEIVKSIKFGPRTSTGDRWWSPSRGMGTLTWMQPPDMHHCRFIPDKGEPVEWRWAECSTGRPGKAPRGKAAIAEWSMWETFTTKHGEVIVLRRGGPPPEGATS